MRSSLVGRINSTFLDFLGKSQYLFSFCGTDNGVVMRFMSQDKVQHLCGEKKYTKNTIDPRSERRCKSNAETAEAQVAVFSDPLIPIVSMMLYPKVAPPTGIKSTDSIYNIIITKGQKSQSMQ